MLIKEAVYLLFRQSRLSNVNSEQQQQMSNMMSKPHQGYYLMMLGLYSWCQSDDKNCLQLLVGAYDSFEDAQDDLFKLLSCRMILHYAHSKKIHNQFTEAFQKLYQDLTESASFQDVKFDLLFEHFDQRLRVCKQVASLVLRTRSVPISQVLSNL